MPGVRLAGFSNIFSWGIILHESNPLSVASQVSQGPLPQSRWISSTIDRAGSSRCTTNSSDFPRQSQYNRSDMASLLGGGGIMSPHASVLAATPESAEQRQALLDELKRRGRACVGSKDYLNGKSLRSWCLSCAQLTQLLLLSLSTHNRNYIQARRCTGRASRSFRRSSMETTPRPARMPRRT